MIGETDPYADFIVGLEGLGLSSSDTAEVLRLGGALSTAAFRAGQADAGKGPARFTPDLPRNVVELPDNDDVVGGLEAPDDDA